MVSTHSRPKAAGIGAAQEGDLKVVFQHTAARRRLANPYGSNTSMPSVSTHSRPKAAGTRPSRPDLKNKVSTHSRPKAAGSSPRPPQEPSPGFNTQPPEGGWRVYNWDGLTATKFQHTAARRRLGDILHMYKSCSRFQHTAARRRLVATVPMRLKRSGVSTHSRPKAAGT